MLKFINLNTPYKQLYERMTHAGGSCHHGRKWWSRWCPGRPPLRPGYKTAEMRLRLGEKTESGAQENTRSRKSGVQTRGIRLTSGRALIGLRFWARGAVSFYENLTGFSSHLLNLARRNWFPGNWIRETASSSTTPEQAAVQVGVQNPLRLLYLSLCIYVMVITVFKFMVITDD